MDPATPHPALAPSADRHAWNAADYHQHSGEQQRWARELFAKLNLRGDEQVLDIGCGDGKVTAELAVLVPDGHVTGIDSSEQMIAFARAAFPEARHPNLRFRPADARRLDFESRFDVVFSNACLHWVYDHRPVLAGIHRSLRPGGRILLQMGGRGNAAEILALAEEARTLPRWREWFAGFDFRYGFHGSEEYTVWLAEAGLQPCRVELLRKDMVHAGAAGLAGWVRTTWLPYTERVPETLRAAFIEEIVRRYVAAHPPDSTGGVHLDMVRLEVEAVRAR